MLKRQCNSACAVRLMLESLNFETAQVLWAVMHQDAASCMRSNQAGERYICTCVHTIAVRTRSGSIVVVRHRPLAILNVHSAVPMYRRNLCWTLAYTYFSVLRRIMVRYFPVRVAWDFELCTRLGSLRAATRSKWSDVLCSRGIEWRTSACLTSAQFVVELSPEQLIKGAAAEELTEWIELLKPRFSCASSTARLHCPKTFFGDAYRWRPKMAYRWPNLVVWCN